MSYSWTPAARSFVAKVMLKYELAMVLIFVGLKMVWLNDLFGGKFPISLSLGIIAGVIAVSVVASLMFRRVTPATEG